MPDEIEELKRLLAEARETIRVQEQRIGHLRVEKQELQDKLDILQRERPRLSPESLMDSFRTALTKMQEGLKTGEGRVNYVLRGFDTDLKTAVTLDDEGNVNFMLPRLEDVVPFENLSTIRFSIAPVPRQPAPPPSTGQIPNLIGLSRDAALRALKAAEFTVGEVDERPSVMPPGTVIEQNPEPYVQAELAMAIDLVISRARETKVPDVIGMERANAIEVIEAARLRVGDVAEEFSDSPPGTVIGQGIPGGTVVPIDMAVALTIAKPEMTKVPDLIGTLVDRAREIVKGARLRIGEMVQEASDSLPGTVIRQRPRAEAEVAINTRVNLVVAKSKRIAVPAVRGLTREAALEAIEGAGLKIGDVVHEMSDEPPGTVIGLHPTAGAEIPPGTAVVVTVSRSETVIVPDLAGLPQDEAERVAAWHDLKVGRIIRRRSREPAGTVIGQKPEPREKVPAGTSIQLTVPIG
jgi:serine/threonine-protein kinase